MISCLFLKNERTKIGFGAVRVYILLDLKMSIGKSICQALGPLQCKVSFAACCWSLVFSSHNSEGSRVTGML